MTDTSILKGVAWLGLVEVKGPQLSRDCLKSDIVNIYHTIGATLLDRVFKLDPSQKLIKNVLCHSSA